MADPDAVPGAAPGARTPPAGSDLVDWITTGTGVGLSITSAIPPVHPRYVTLVIPDDDHAKTRTDQALVAALRAHSTERLWWLGHLDTGAADLVTPDAPRVAVHMGWPYVLLEGGPRRALTARRNEAATPWHSALPELVFPADRSWLVATLWDDDWRCIGGPDDLVDALLRHPDLDTRAVTPGEDATPPGHVAR